MEGVKYIVGAAVAWVIVLVLFKLLFQRGKEGRNPLDWPEVDRCLFLISTFFFLGVVFNFSSGMMQLFFGKSLSHINQAFLEPFLQILRSFALVWFILMFIGVWLRKRGRQSLIFTHAVVQFSAVFTASFCYMWGAATEIGPWLFGMALGAFSLILFRPAVALPWIPTFLVLTVGSQVAVWLDLIPYSPVFGSPPFEEGKPVTLHWIVTLLWSSMTCTLMLLLLNHVVMRWRDRESKVADMTDLLKRMFGRYLSTEVMKTLLENPAALELGGERRRVTIMMTDLRGFTALAERLEPEQVVQMLNTYFDAMVDVVLKYGGTINEIVGDALLVVFGAPQDMPDRAKRAVACAIEMQNTIKKVNDQNQALGLPELEMGVGLNDAEVIVGNIGSSKRSKYAVVGSGVNLTSRIESYSVGGQILISDSVRKEAGGFLRIDGRKDVIPKGSETALRIYEVGGIGGPYNLAVEKTDPLPINLSKEIPIHCRVLEGKQGGMEGMDGKVKGLSRKSAWIDLPVSLEVLSDLKMNIQGVEEDLALRDFYGKVVDRLRERGGIHLIRFTSVPPEVAAFFQAHRQHVVHAMEERQA